MGRFGDSLVGVVVVHNPELRNCANNCTCPSKHCGARRPGPVTSATPWLGFNILVQIAAVLI